MYKIKNTDIDSARKLYVDKALWGYNKYIPQVYAQIVHDDENFYVKFTVHEKNPTRTKTKNFEYVHLDSCVEFFANFMPEKSDYYINFEMNANGVVNFAFKKDRYNSIELTEEDALGLEIKSDIFEDYWTVSYKITSEFLKKYYKDFEMNECKRIKGNLYKCGDETPIEHYLCHFEVKCENPDFHRPEYFGEIEVE